MDNQSRAYQSYGTYLSLRMVHSGCVQSFEVEEEIQKQRLNTEMLIIQFLSTCLPKRKFYNEQFSIVIEESSTRRDFDITKLSEAFMHLENYFILLYIMPWKQEFHQIKKYGGYYQTQIESNLHNAENILQLIGYKEIKYGLLQLTKEVDLGSLHAVAFDCFVSSIECKIIANIWDKICNSGGSLRDIVKVRLENGGSEEQIVDMMLLKYKKRPSVSDNVLDCVECEIEKTEKSRPQNLETPDQFRNKLKTHLKTAKEFGGDMEDIPFMDEPVKECQYTPVNMDEQMIASLNLINNPQNKVESSNRVVSGMKPSQEWSFVREGLEKNYGKKYFEGPRKDILLSESGVDTNKNDVNFVKTSGLNPGHEIYYAGPNAMKDQFYPTPSYGKDSDYNTASTAFYPPTVDDINTMRARGLVTTNHTDTVLAKSPSSINHERSLRSKTEPIARRHKSEQIPMHPTYPSISSVNQYSKPSVSNENIPTDSSDMKMYHRPFTGISRAQTHPPKSGPIMPNPTQYLPVVHNSGSLANKLGSFSFNEKTKSSVNVPDSMSNTASRSTVVHSAPLPYHPPQWHCSFCTYINTPNSLICEMCSKTPDGNDIDSTSGQTSKICEQCTLENDKKAIDCRACGHRLKGAQTSV
ncbi:spermatogenesis-associated protein 2 [Mactra antiquata]